MRDSYIGNEEIVTNITNTIWDSTIILRNYLIEDRLDVILFLITVINKDWRLKHVYQDQYNKSHIKIEMGAENTPQFSVLSDIYIPVLETIPFSGLGEIINAISLVDKEDLKYHFSHVFEGTLQKLVDFKGKKSGESILPTKVSQLIIKLADLESNAKIYNPFAGLASFAIFLQKGQKYYGQEINQLTWAIGQMRLMANQKDHNSIFEISDSIDNWKESEKFDLIVSSPPFKLPVPPYMYSELTGEIYGTVENFLVDKGIHSLNSNGQLIAIFSLSFLFSGGRDGRLRKRLIQNDFIDTVISLPPGLLSNTSIPFCIVIFKTKSRNPGYVRMVDASTFFTKEGPRDKFLNEDTLFELISKNSENQFLRYVSNSEIHKNDFDLTVGRYFLRDIQGASLSSFTDIIRGPKAPLNSSMRQVQIRNLKENVFNSNLKSEEIELKPCKRGTFSVIEETCILVATRWNMLKPTYFEYTGEPIVISQAIVALKINENVVDPTFLINEFSADYIKEQLDGYRIGSVQPMLRLKDLKNVIFQLPSIQEQRAKVSGIIELSSRLKELEVDKENLLSGIKKEETESSTSLSHILGKPLLSIGSSLEIIQNVLAKLDPNWRDILISENRQFKMSDAFDSISRNVKYIQELADDNTTLVSVSSFNLAEVRFLKFLSEFVKSERKSLKNKIDLILDIHEDIRVQMDNQVLIKGNEQKLRIVLINLIDNAKNHAFTDQTKENKILIEILPFTGNEQEASLLNYDIVGRKSYVELKVSNTGKPFPKDFTLNDYVRKNFAAGDTRNRGLGGFEVNEILKVHNEGKKALNIISSGGNQEFSTTISFIIPVI